MRREAARLAVVSVVVPQTSALKTKNIAWFWHQQLALIVFEITHKLDQLL